MSQNIKFELSSLKPEYWTEADPNMAYYYLTIYKSSKRRCRILGQKYIAVPKTWPKLELKDLS